MYMYNLASITLLDQSKLLQTEGLLVVKKLFCIYFSHFIFIFSTFKHNFSLIIGNFTQCTLIILTYQPSHALMHTHITHHCGLLSPIFCPCSHWSTVKLLVASPLKRSESFPSHTLSCAIHLWRATFQCPYHNF